MRGLVLMLVVSVFFTLALTPGVNYLHAQRGWRRGAAVAVIYVAGVVAVLVMVVLVVPAIAKVGGQISGSGTQWMTSLDTWTSSKLGFHIVGKQAYKDGVVTVGEFLKQWAGKLLPAAGKVVSSGAALVFKLATIGLFTFYLTADFPRLQRALLSWFKPGQQERLGWTVDQSIKQVGGYLYSRLLLTVINGLGFVAVMIAVGVPTGLAIPLAVFGGFVSEFIPSVGTYIGGAVPAVLTLALAGPVPALIVIAYIVVYQQIENYWLSPRISAKTMELNGGLAFGAAIAGGALFGPIGAFMALPVAALIVAVVQNYRHAYPVFYRVPVRRRGGAGCGGSGGGRGERAGFAGRVGSSRVRDGRRAACRERWTGTNAGPQWPRPCGAPSSVTALRTRPSATSPRSPAGLAAFFSSTSATRTSSCSSRSSSPATTRLRSMGGSSATRRGWRSCAGCSWPTRDPMRSSGW